MAGRRLLTNLRAIGARPALVDAHGAYSYEKLASSSEALASMLLAAIPAARADARPPRVAYMCPRDSTYVQSQLAAWATGSIGVPIAENYPPSEIEYVLRDCGASAVLSDSSKGELIGPVATALGIPRLAVSRLAPCAPSLSALRAAASAAPAVAPPTATAFAADDGALLIYTSGTTGRPKGVLTSHRALNAQVTALTSSWEWTPSDHIYSVLPLHHVHDVVALLNSALWSGAVCEIVRLQPRSAPLPATPSFS
jgi:malonyl-CoA/methylmalonyl-CoA synthetase